MSGNEGRWIRRWGVALFATLVISSGSLLGAATAHAAPNAPSPTPSGAPSATPSRAPSSTPLATTVTMTTPTTLDYGAPIDLAATVVDSTGAPAVGTVQFDIAGGTNYWTPIDLVDGSAHIVFSSLTNGTTVNPYLWSPPSLAIGATFIPADPEALEPASGAAVVTIRKGVAVVIASLAEGQTLLPSSTATVVAEIGQQGIPLTSYWRPAEITGSLDFLLDGVVVATSPVVTYEEERRGIATAQISVPAQGTGTLTATYSGNGTYATTTSAPVALTVVPASSTPSAAPAPVKTAPRPTTIPAPPRPAAPAAPETETAVEAPPASSPVAISSTPVADVGPARGLVLTGLVAALLLLAAAGALVTIRLRRR